MAEADSSKSYDHADLPELGPQITQKQKDIKHTRLIKRGLERQQVDVSGVQDTISSKKSRNPPRKKDLHRLHYLEQGVDLQSRPGDTKGSRSVRVGESLKGKFDRRTHQRIPSDEEVIKRHLAIQSGLSTEKLNTKQRTLVVYAIDMSLKKTNMKKKQPSTICDDHISVEPPGSLEPSPEARNDGEHSGQPPGHPGDLELSSESASNGDRSGRPSGYAMGNIDRRGEPFEEGTPFGSSSGNLKSPSLSSISSYGSADSVCFCVAPENESANEYKNQQMLVVTHHSNAVPVDQNGLTYFPFLLLESDRKTNPCLSEVRNERPFSNIYPCKELYNAGYVIP